MSLCAFGDGVARARGRPDRGAAGQPADEAPRPGRRVDHVALDEGRAPGPGLGLGLAVALAPVEGDLLARVMPEAAHEHLVQSSSRARVAIARSFGAAVAADPWRGVGYGTSARFAETPVAGTPPRPVTCRPTVPDAVTFALGAPLPTRVSRTRAGSKLTNAPGMTGSPERK